MPFWPWKGQLLRLNDKQRADILKKGNVALNAQLPRATMSFAIVEMELMIEIALFTIIDIETVPL